MAICEVYIIKPKILSVAKVRVLTSSCLSHNPNSEGQVLMCLCSLKLPRSSDPSKECHPDIRILILRKSAIGTLKSFVKILGAGPRAKKLV